MIRHVTSKRGGAAVAARVLPLQDSSPSFRVTRSAPFAPPTCPPDRPHWKLRVQISATYRRRIASEGWRGGGDPPGIFRRGQREALPMECLPRTSPLANQDPPKNFRRGGSRSDRTPQRAERRPA